MKKVLILIFMLLSINVWASINFDGVDDGVTSVDAPMENLTQFSCCVWVYHNSDSSDDDIFNKYDGDGFLMIRDNSWAGGSCTDCYQMYVDEGVDACYGGTPTDSGLAGSWKHLCMTFEAASSTGLRVYINGAETPASPFDCTDVDNTGASNPALSIGEVNTFGDEFDGLIDEPSCWSSVLTPQEVALLYNSKSKRMPLQIQSSNLIFYYAFDQEPNGDSYDGVTILDLSGNGNHGTGDDGANNTGLTAASEQILTYP